MISIQHLILILSLLSTGVYSATTCNPMSTTCSANPALATSFSEDFKSSSPYFEAYQASGAVHYTDNGLELTLAERFDNPSIVSKDYMLFGRVEAIVKASLGTGIISTLYLQSDVLDELDWEWFGGDASQTAINYFSKGITGNYDRGTLYDMVDPRADFHNYTMDWTPTECTWYVDGVVARVLESTDPKGYPSTPSRLFIGLWAGGDASNAEGTIEWAGGATDYSQAPFTMTVKELVVTDYSSGTEYSYDDMSGDLSSIQVKDGEVNGRHNQAVQEFDLLLDGQTISGASSSAFSSSDMPSSSFFSSSSALPSSSFISSSSALPSSSFVSSSSALPSSSGYNSSSVTPSSSWFSSSSVLPSSSFVSSSSFLPSSSFSSYISSSHTKKSHEKSVAAKEVTSTSANGDSRDEASAVPSTLSTVFSSSTSLHSISSVSTGGALPDFHQTSGVLFIAIPLMIFGFA